MDESFELLARAVRRNTPVTVTASIDEKEHACEAKLVATRTHGLWAQPSAGSRAPLQRAIQDQAPVRVLFTMDGRRMAFNTRLLKLDRHCWLNDQMMIEAVQLDEPERVDQVEQREHPRALVSDSADLRGTLYRLPRPHIEKSKAPAALAMPAKLWDLGRGGVSFVCAYERTISDQLYARMPMCIALEFRGKKLLLDGELRYHRQMNSRMLRIGLAFDLAQSTSLPPELDEVIEHMRARQSLVGYRSAAK